MTDEVALPRRARELLGTVVFRAAGEQPLRCYLASAGRGRYALVVGQLHAPDSLARLRAVNWDTVRTLLAAGLVEVADTYEPITYPRRHLDSPDGRRITPTPAGRTRAGAPAPAAPATGTP